MKMTIIASADPLSLTTKFEMWVYNHPHLEVTKAQVVAGNNQGDMPWNMFISYKERFPCPPEDSRIEPPAFPPT
jgi:hypothetical protein